MGVKTLAEMRTAVRSLYGDFDGVTAADAEVDLHLKDGVNRILNRCPWLVVSVTAPVTQGTDPLGGWTLPDANIAQIFSIELLRTDGTYTKLIPIQSAVFNTADTLVASTVDGVTSYYLEGSRVTFYPIFRSGVFDARLSYASNSIGSAFPTASGNPLPASLPAPVEDAAIRYAVAQFYIRDNDLESAQFILNDFESRVMELTGLQNRPQRGEILKVYDTDPYYLEV